MLKITSEHALTFDNIKKLISYKNTTAKNTIFYTCWRSEKYVFTTEIKITEHSKLEFIENDPIFKNFYKFWNWALGDKTISYFIINNVGQIDYTNARDSFGLFFLQKNHMLEYKKMLENMKIFND